MRHVAIILMKSLFYNGGVTNNEIKQIHWMLWNYILPDELFLVGNHSFSKTQNGVRFFTCQTIKPRNKGTWSPCHYMKVILPRHFLRKLKTAIWQPKTYKNFDYKVLANDFLEKNMLNRVEMGSHMTRTEGKMTHTQKNTCVAIEFSLLVPSLHQQRVLVLCFYQVTKMWL